ncbi:MAG: hypothetical protein HRT38_15405 [Alteromonadaceae bacterium]|nr:hypothetical protein [Alteromonadaceae bacterium]
MKFKCLNAALAVIVLSVSCLVNIAQAGLIEADYLVYGDGLAAYDDVTGVTWLDLSVTEFLTYNEASYFSTEFRIASDNELKSLHASLIGSTTDKFNQFSAVGLSNGNYVNRAAGFVFDGYNGVTTLGSVDDTGVYTGGGYTVWENHDWGGDSVAIWLATNHSKHQLMCQNHRYFLF